MRQLSLTRKEWQIMQEDAIRSLPAEACGLVGGKGERASCVFPITNELHSPARFRMLPGEQLNAMLKLEDAGLDIVAIYHSHPSGPHAPSPTDLKEFNYPGTVMIIWFGVKDGWDAKGFEIVGGSIFPVSLTILD